MSRRREALLVVIQAGMEMSWLHAFNSFVSLAITGHHLSFVNALAVFVVGALATLVSLGRGWRIITVLAVQLSGLASVAGVVIYTTLYASYRVLSMDWLRAAFYDPRSFTQWLELVVTLLSILLFWVCGVFLARRRMTYSTVCSRFDMGLASFFSIYLIQLAVLFKGGRVITDGGAIYSLFSFFLLGLLAIGTARVGGTASKGFLPGYGIVGIVAGFCAVVLLTTGSIVLFFLPALRKAAEVGYSVMEIGGRSIAPIAITVVRFLFGPRSMRSEPSAASPKSTAAEHIMTSNTWWEDYLQTAIEWGMKAFAAAVLLFSAALILFIVVKWLLARTGTADQRERQGGRLVNLLLRLWNLLVSLFGQAQARFKGYRKAADLYGALLSWGRRSGISLSPSDTPSEFGDRLCRLYPRLENSIRGIVAAFNKEAYSGTATTADQLAGAHTNLRTLRNPRHWPRRLRTRVFAPRKESDRPATQAK